jgi:hypothetical protein
MKINIAKALKIKNRIVQKMITSRNTLHHKNSWRSDNPKSVEELQEIAKTYKEEFEKLKQIKILLSQNSVGIVPALVELAETKGEIAFYNEMVVREGPEKMAYGKEVYDYVWTSFITGNQKAEILDDLNEKCAELQDQIDDFNAKTFFDWPHNG